MSRFTLMLSSTVILAVSGCVSLPSGPSVMVLPGTGLSFDQFRNDDAICQQYASFQVGGTTANQAAVNSGVTSAAVGTALGAAAGAAIGGGRGAAIGAGSGLVGGSLVGTGAASSSMYGVQQHYDIAYIQCMYAKGHQVPVSGQFSGAISQPQVVPPASYIQPSPDSTPPTYIPPPPAGLPPAPPQ
ncbi:MAG: glycine zipper family protein [Methylobacter sp.]|uniref:Glycine zipper family protein n=1 Tax=Candidatus Methylobacter titanis TaxID=3053457 RepID=A0AA43Q409_9GAMM|nr:glycine zipper family protein [Candidatus Methylobacter titanis]